MNRTHFLVLMALALLIVGCQSSQPASKPGAAVSPIESCQQMIALVDQTVVEAGTTDTSVFRIKGFPYLRINRFLAETAAMQNSPPAIRQWLTYMHQLDLAAREKEILNLDNHQFLQLVNQARPQTDRRTFIEEACACSDRLFRNSANQQDLVEDVKDAIDIPSEYRTWRRMVGLYPLVALPVGIASNDAFDEFRAWHTTPPERLPQIGQPVVYRSAGLSEDSRIDPVLLYQKTPMNALGLPQLSPQDEQRLVEALAPTIVQDTLAGYDRIGQVRWSDGELTIARGAPTSYYYLSHGRLRNRPSLQINYVFWYSHRSGDNAPWIEWGRLDGLTVRISLDHTGRPVMLDIMNNCGCYHFFVPDQTQIRSVQTTFMGIDPLVPAWLPEQFPDRRLRLMVSSGWHQVQNVGEDNSVDEIVPYKLRPYHELEMLADENGQHRSMFDSDGIAWGSDRVEPALFFSMGIPSVGSMRQRGHHPIKLVGRAHFDDPQLFDETFEYR